MSTKTCLLSYLCLSVLDTLMVQQDCVKAVFDYGIYKCSCKLQGLDLHEQMELYTGGKGCGAEVFFSFSFSFICNRYLEVA